MLRFAYGCVLALALVACAKDPDHETKEPGDDPRVAQLEESMAANLAEAKALRAPNGWLVEGGDGMLWTGKYDAVVCDVDLEAAEIAPGKFGRDPDGETSTNPEWSGWSRDMGTGLLGASWRCGKLAILERHAAYGAANDWQMGDPLGDGRSLYTPAFVGRLYQTVYAMGGEDNANRLWPDFYPAGLVDYQAHLQVMNIWHRGEVAEALRKKGVAEKPNPEPIADDASDEPAPPAGFALLDVSAQQYLRLEEHAARDTRDPLFAAMLGTYTGDMGPAFDVCLDPTMPVGEYVRCDGDERKCQLAAWIFACDLVLRRYRDDQPAES